MQDESRNFVLTNLNSIAVQIFSHPFWRQLDLAIRQRLRTQLAEGVRAMSESGATSAPTAVAATRAPTTLINDTYLMNEKAKWCAKSSTARPSSNFSKCTGELYFFFGLVLGCGY